MYLDSTTRQQHQYLKTIQQLNQCPLLRFTLVRILKWTLAFPQGDGRFPISALMLSTAESADRCIQCQSAIVKVPQSQLNYDSNYSCYDYKIIFRLILELWFKILYTKDRPKKYLARQHYPLGEGSLYSWSPVLQDST